MVLVVVYWVVGFDGEDEVRGDELGALVKKLVEGMLGVSGWLSENNSTSGVFNEAVGGTRDGLSVGFHGQLLEIGGESVEILIEATQLVQGRKRAKEAYGETKCA